MKNSNIENSTQALKKQLTVIEDQIRELQLIKSRLLHRCSLMEQAMYYRNSPISVETVAEQYLLCQEVEPPYSLTEVSIATKKCFASALAEKLPIFFQTGVIVPIGRIRSGRYTEASEAFLPIEKQPGSGAIRTMPTGTCISIYHFGNYESIGVSYDRLLSHCADHGIRICSDSYEFCINDYITSSDENEYITKILFYIEGAGGTDGNAP